MNDIVGPPWLVLALALIAALPGLLNLYYTHRSVLPSVTNVKDAVNGQQLALHDQVRALEGHVGALETLIRGGTDGSQGQGTGTNNGAPGSSNTPGTGPT